ncbi:Stk1 family PASTA domain-containing Ser/Thr kinase [Prauserella muralis]|uniref:non-specific serine/threonine protein kinase n=1 Tax=Prauserella muralis TaxID=588067 RepID=A0A2V4AJ09_9PSEU|nr:PASTA domain-containing protein [Prauserella muralis]PXY19621.1 serine/threonine protein kinase [Prauserella muralis]TWE29630.1 serine/threonine-protein kinase [Prauserella muralis]
MTGTEPSLVGSLLDRRYRVDRLLARGGMSSVYRGVDTRLDRPVAIKIMDSRFADDRTFVDRFEREARSAARLHHPHVVAVHDQGFDTAGGPDERRAFLVMELVDGGTLRDLLDQRGALDLPLALTIAEQVLSALAAAHTEGLVHRDVKPENVLIGRGGGALGSGVVKVGDFGLVRAVASAGTTSASVILGTVAYLSPEQVTTGAASERGDVYSAGILLYEMLTGHVPYTADTAISVAYRHVNDDVPRPSEARADLPPALDDLVLRATRRDPDARPADAGAFLAELAEVRSQLGIPRAPVPVPAGPADAATEITDAEKTVPAMRAVTSQVPAGGPRGTQALPRGPLVAEQPPPPAEPMAAADAPQPRRRRWVALWLVVGLLLAGGIGAGVWWFTGGRYVDVPQVTGLDRTQAEQVLRRAELVPSFTEERHNTAPSGTVIRSDPESGSRALAGDEVTVVLSLGRPVVPDITPGSTVAQAEQAIRAVQLQPRRDAGADQYSADVPEGAVVTVSPKPGNQANIGDAVTIVVSKGPPPTPVPSVRGLSRDEAFQKLREAGFEPFDAGEEFAADVPAGHVTRTDPAEGATLTDAKRVGVYVSNAVEVPSVLGRQIDEALQILADAGLTSNAEDRRGRFAFVLDQDPDPGTLVQKGTTINLNVVP